MSKKERVRRPEDPFADLRDRLHLEDRSAVAKATGLSYAYLSKVIYDDIKNPGARQLDILRSHLKALDLYRASHQ